jgi:hypothetical protein
MVTDGTARAGVGRGVGVGAARLGTGDTPASGAAPG